MCRSAAGQRGLTPPHAPWASPGGPLRRQRPAPSAGRRLWVAASGSEDGALGTAAIAAGLVRGRRLGGLLCLLAVGLEARHRRPVLCLLAVGLEARHRRLVRSVLNGPARPPSAAPLGRPGGGVEGAVSDGTLAAQVANPVVFWSEYTLKTTGAGLPPGPGGALGALEGVSYLVILGVVSWSIATKVQTGTGLPAGPSGLLGAVEGLRCGVCGPAGELRSGPRLERLCFLSLGASQRRRLWWPCTARSAADARGPAATQLPGTARRCCGVWAQRGWPLIISRAPAPGPAYCCWIFVSCSWRLPLEFCCHSLDGRRYRAYGGVLMPSDYNEPPLHGGSLQRESP